MAANSPHNAQTPSAMGPPTHPASIPSRKLDIGSLMSPPDQALDSFGNVYHHHHNTGEVDDSSSKNASGKHPMPMSPPISPCNRAMATTETPTNSIQDPVLYPSDEVPSSPAQTPLFATLEDRDHSRTIDEHIQKNIDEKIFIEVQPPTRNDYELVISFRSQLNKNYEVNPRAWMLQVNRQAREDNRAIAQAKARARPLVAKAAKTSRPRTDNRVQKPPQRSIRAHPTNSPKRPTPQVSVNGTAEPKPRAQGPDKDFEALPNFCPPLESLPARSTVLKVDWKGQPLDNSNDPHQNLLHPDELTLASNLRLDCATYLTSKRRIFISRLSCYKRMKDFRKTDAQQACKIDVNKASKLWTAFDKAGWFQKKWMEPFENIKLN
jgi:hypothetical protein